jgi:pimeloyl-ACP methyl ester carboxylesterase
MASHSLGLTLYDAARQMGVSFSQENEPADKSVQVDGMNFHYLEWGDSSNPTILMLHGNSQQSHSWDFVSLALSEQFHLIVLDQRGHGDSDWASDGDYSVEAQQKDIDGFVQAVGLDGFTMMGHSMGGRNSYVWASRHPGALKALVIVDTGPQTQRTGANRIQQFKELPDELDTFDEFVARVQEYTGRTQEQVLGALKYSIRQRADGKWTWKYDKVMRTPGGRAPGWNADQLWECVGKIDCPTLVLRGDRSDIFAEETMQRMGEVIADCTTTTISNAGHLVQGDNPAEFLVEVGKFLGRVH